MYTGIEKYLAIAKETTFGTAGATRGYARVTQFGVKGTPEQKRPQEHLGQPDQTGHIRNKLNVQGTIAGLAYGMGAVPLAAAGAAIPIEQWWKWAFDRTSNQLDSLTGEWSGGDDPVQVLGMKVNTIKLSSNADGGDVMFELGIIGQDEIPLSSALAVPSSDPYGASSGRRPGPMAFQAASSLFEIDDTAKELAGWELNVNNKLAAAWLGKRAAGTGFSDCQILSAMKPGGHRDITGSIKVLYEDTFYTAKVRTDTRFKLEIAIQGYKDATTDRRGVFTLTGTVPADFQREENLDQFGFLTIPFYVEKVGSTAIVSAAWSDVTV